MYRIYHNDELLYDPRVEELAVFNKKLSLEVNRSGGFDFTIYPSHPMYNRIKKMKSIISVSQVMFDGDIEFEVPLYRGRVLDEGIDFYNAKHVICEGMLGFFNDSIIRPYEYTGSVDGFLQFVIDEHNRQVNASKKFSLGSVTVTDPNDYIVRSSINTESSWDVINGRLLDMLGGYIFVRREHTSDGYVNYIDYLADSDQRSLQEITLGENLLDLTKNIKGQDIITALIPFGAKLKDEEGNDTDERLTIESVNDGVDYVFNQEAVDEYGWIFGTSTWDDVTVPQNLLSRADAELAARMNLGISIEVNAIDLSMTDEEIDEFRIFEYVKANSPSHQLDDFMLITKLDIDLDNPQNNKLALGMNYSTFTEKQVQTEQAVKEVKNQVSRSETRVSNEIRNVQTTLRSDMEQTAEEIKSEVSRDYLAQADFSMYQETVSTQFSQTAEAFQFNFNELIQTFNTLDGETQTQFAEFFKYIRFEDGNIILGEENNPLVTRFENDRWAIIKDGVPVMYLDENEIYITDARILKMLRIGNFAFIPRNNGDLSFNWVGE